MTWRLLRHDEVSASFGLATDETLAHRVGRHDSPPTLRLYSYRSHCALVGRFQNVSHEVHVGFCRENDIVINRRPTGGGAIIMGADQLGVALCIPGRDRHVYGGARELMRRFSAGLIAALHSLGVEAAFRRKNDLEIDGRKIAGLGIYRDRSGGLLFHASLLIDLDVPLMLQVLRIPLAKISDKEVTGVAARTRTLRGTIGPELSFDAIRDEVASGYAAAFDLDLEPGELTTDEVGAIRQLERSRYDTDEWIFQRTDIPDLVGAARVKTEHGLLDVRVQLAGRQLKAVHLSGDFFAPSGAVADLEASLRWHSSEPEAIRNTLDGVYARWSGDLDALPIEQVVAILGAAIARDDTSESVPSTLPYGCFVTPGAEHA